MSSYWIMISVSMNAMIPKGPTSTSTTALIVKLRGTERSRIPRVDTSPFVWGGASLVLLPREVANGKLLPAPRALRAVLGPANARIPARLRLPRPPLKQRDTDRTGTSARLEGGNSMSTLRASLGLAPPADGDIPGLQREVVKRIAERVHHHPLELLNHLLLPPPIMRRLPRVVAEADRLRLLLLGRPMPFPMVVARKPPRRNRHLRRL
jgi:hypothetical protein